VLFCEFYDLLPCFQCSQASKPLRSIPWPAAQVAGLGRGFDDVPGVCDRLMDLSVRRN